MADVSDTAATIARIRAAEAELPAGERLFHDPYASLFVDGDAEVDARFGTIPYLRESVRLRTRLIDDFVRAALARGVKQVVVLGVGFDCRAQRLPEIAAAGATVFEVDLAAQLARKADRLARAHVAPVAWVRAVPCDFTAEAFDATLRRDLVGAGLRCSEPIAFLWEGVVGYLDDAPVDRTLRFIAELGAPGSAVVFNYSLNRFTPETLPARLRRAGFTHVDDDSLAAAHRRLLGTEPPDYAQLFRLAVAHT